MNGPLGTGRPRYAIFAVVVVLATLSPALPHQPAPQLGWWSAGAALVTVMFVGCWLGSRRPTGHWLNTVSPLLLMPAVHALRCADGNAASGFAPLVLLPVLWFALYGRSRDVALSVVAGAATLLLPMIIVGAPQFPATSWRGILLLVVLSAALGPLIHRLVTTTARAGQALSRSEGQFRAAFEDAPVGMAITGLHGAQAYRFVRVNRALCQMFGRPAHELTSVPISSLTHPDDLDLTEHAFSVAVDPSTPNRIEKRYLHKSGRTIWASIFYSVVHDEDGVPSHLVSQIEDVSARHESDRALLDAFETEGAATEELKRLERMRVEMASVVSHELRTPLTSAAGYVELLAEGDAGPLNAEQRAMLGTVVRSLARLDGIIDDVLGRASSERPNAPQLGDADAGHVLRGAAASVALQAATRGQDLIIRNDLDGTRVVGDAGRLERVVVNLLSNAVKFTPDDGTITLTGQRDGDHATVTVVDTGIGIGVDDQKRIFERFYRADRGIDSTAGTGLGLAIVRTITTQYGGKITVRSELGRGSTFTLTLPIRPDPI